MFGREFPIKGIDLPDIPSVAALARELGIDKSRLDFLAGLTRPTADQYRHFVIPKRQGGVRHILAPRPELATVQTWILHSILRRVLIHPSATAYRTGKSIKHNAAVHCHQSIVLRVDLQDFFHSIGFEHIRAVFASLGYRRDVSNLFAWLCTASMPGTFNAPGSRTAPKPSSRRLAQGSPSSPALANIVCIPLDTYFGSLAGIEYSRYADDLVFSWSGDRPKVAMILRVVRTKIAEEGFSLNPAKTRIMRSNQRQVVSGLVVNGAAPRVSRTDIRQFRSLLHHIECDGAVATSEQLGMDALKHAEGYLSYISMISQEQAFQVWRRHQWLRLPASLVQSRNGGVLSNDE